jgi:hypothetical protein
LDQLVTSLLMQLQKLGTAHEILEQATAVLSQHLATAVTLTFPLIPETGGVPAQPPACYGTLLQGDSLQSLTTTACTTGTVGDLIRYGQPYYEHEAQTWAKIRPSTDFPYFIQCEEIQSFVALPITNQTQKLALILLAYRQPQIWSAEWRRVVEACGFLIATCLSPSLPDRQQKQNRMAMAHTLYGNVANLFKGQLDALETEMMEMLGENVPMPLAAHLATAKEIAFEEMRNLVIEASGDLLVNLREMPLYKALITTTAALERAWPQGQAIQIEIAPIPYLIEQQSPALRELLYTLVLEAMGNAIKHGGPAPYIHVGMRWQQNQIYVQILDHGCGFERWERPFSPYGLGYWQAYITQRLGGVFQVSSQPKFGTVINAQIPVIPVRSSAHA